MTELEYKRIEQEAIQNEKNKEQAKYNLIKKECCINDVYIEILENFKPVINSFDGKIYNVKLVKALRDTIDNKDINVYIDTDYDRIEIAIYDRDKTRENYVMISNSIPIYYSFLIRNEHIYIYCTKLFDITETGKKRINAKDIIESIEQKQKYLKEENIKKLDNLKNIEQMKKDLTQIKELMSKFQENYDFSLRDLFGCNYELKDRSSYTYR